MLMLDFKMKIFMAIFKLDLKIISTITFIAIFMLESKLILIEIFILELSLY